MVGRLAFFAFLSCACGAEFDVATVRNSPPPPGDLININPGRVRNGRLTFANASLSDCLKFAWGITSDEQISGPDWIKSKAVRFDIVAQAPPGTPEEQFPLMLQALLAERLGLALHHEQRTFPYLAVVVGKGGPKMPQATSDASPARSSAMAGRIAVSSISMQRFAMFLSRFERQIILDRTGLEGSWDVTLDWTPADSHPAAVANTDGASIFTALQEQLGLRLESRRGPIDVLVIDHAERIPTAN
jgi:uncharacterized protein (TIGR03435 family)